MAGKIEIADVALSHTIDPPLVEALRQIIGNQRAVIDHVLSDVVSFASVAATTVIVPHKLDKKPTYWRVLDTNGTATIHAADADKALWNDKTVVFTTSATGTTFTVEVM